MSNKFEIWKGINYFRAYKNDIFIGISNGASYKKIQMWNAIFFNKQLHDHTIINGTVTKITDPKKKFISFFIL